MLKRYLIKLSWLVLLLVPLIAFSDDAPQSPDFNNWVELLKKQALSAGISQTTIDSAFFNLAPIAQTATFRSPTSKLFLDQYLNIALSDQQLTYEKNLLQRFGNILFEISHLFSVEPEVLVAVWSVDNLERKDHQSFPAIELLVSTTFHEPQNKQAREELLDALKLLDSKQVDPASFTSDENGLLGSVFFKPSILKAYGIDYDEDGKIDVWNDYADILASTANYLSSIGWKSKNSWGMEVKLPDSINPVSLDINIQRPVNYWDTQGIRLLDGSELPLDASMASLIKPEAYSDRILLILDNYFALLRWKRSHAFALAVGLTVDKLKPVTTDNPTTPFSVN